MAHAQLWKAESFLHPVFCCLGHLYVTSATCKTPKKLSESIFSCQTFVSMFGQRIWHFFEPSLQAYRLKFWKSVARHAHGRKFWEFWHQNVGWMTPQVWIFSKTKGNFSNWGIPPTLPEQWVDLGPPSTMHRVSSVACRGAVKRRQRRY